MKERFNIAFRYLVGQGLIKTQKELASRLKYAIASISKAMNGDEKYLTESFLVNFNKAFDDVFNIDWLLTGEGDMLKNSKPLSAESPEEPYITTKAGIKYYQLPNGKFRMRVPIVPIYAYAKYIDEIRDADIWDGDGYFDFPVDQIYHGNYQAFEIKGDSMDDDSKRSLSHGDIVNARELGHEHWKSKLHTDQFPNWIIVTDTTILCKQIIKQDLETGDITCHSLNPSPEYADFIINLDEVRKLFNVVQRVSSSF